MCANCRARGVAGAQFAAQYMIRTAKQSGARGPMVRDEVVRGIAKGRYGPDDFVSAVGGEEHAVADHPDFRSAFIPGSDLDQRIEAMRSEAESVRRRAKVTGLLKYVAAGGLLACSAGAIAYGSQSRTFVLPEPVLVKLERQIEWWQNELKESQVYESVPTISDLPHGDWMDANRPADDARTLHEGRRELWWSDYRGLGTVRRAFLAAGARAPLDPMPMVGLILVDAQMLGTRPELLGEIARAQTRLDSMRNSGPSAAAAEGAWLLAQGQRTGAAQATEPFIESDLMCRLIHAEATTDPEAVQAVLDAIGPSPLVLRALARVAESATDWNTLKYAGSALVEAGPDGPDGHEVLSRFHAVMGSWERAAEEASRALQRGSERADMLHTVAVAGTFAGRNNETTARMYSQLVEHPHLAGHTNRQTVLVQAAQAMVKVGDLEGATEFIEAAREAEQGDPNAAVVWADILYKNGQHGDAEAVLRDLDLSGVDDEAAAMVHLWSARLYLEMNKQRLARTELEEAERLAPDWPLVVEELAWAAIESGDPLAANEAIERTVFLHPFRERAQDPLDGTSVLAPKRRRIGRPMLKAMGDDVRYETVRVATAAILAWQRGVPGHYAQLLDAVERDPDHLALNGAVAFAAFEAGDWERAAQHSLTVVMRRPSLGVMQSVRGMALAKMGNMDDARDPLSRSTKTDLGRAVMLRQAASAHAGHGAVDVAIDLLEEAASIAPEDARIRAALFALQVKNK